MKRRRLAAAAAVAAVAVAIALTGGGQLLTMDRATDPPASPAHPIRYLGFEGVRMQTGAVDCGVAALEMILESFGAAAPGLPEARAAALEAGKPLSLMDLSRLAGARGLRGVGWTGGMEDLWQVPKPLIAYTDFHFVVVDSFTTTGVHVRDPSLGRLRYDAQAFRQEWSGIAMSFVRDPER